MLLNLFLQAQGQQQGSAWQSIAMLVLIFVIFYFFMIRPQQKRQKEIAKFRQNLTTNDKVVTAGGIYGKIKEVHDNYFIIEIAENTRIRIAKESVYPSAEETPKQA